MNSKIYIAFIIFMVGIQFSCEKKFTEPAGLLDGYSFETDPVQFSPYSEFADNYTLSWTNEEAFDGENSLSISTTQTNNQSFAFWNLSYLDFEPNQPFKVRVKVKTVDMEGSGGIQMNMFARSKDGTNHFTSGLGEKISNTNGEWETIEVSLARNPTDAVGYIDIYFLFLAGSTGTAYWDKLEIFTGE